MILKVVCFLHENRFVTSCLTSLCSYSGQSYYADHENRGIDDGHRSDGRQTTGKDGSPDEDQDGSWYIGKARDDFNRRQRGPDQGAPINDHDDDPVQVSFLEYTNKFVKQN